MAIYDATGRTLTKTDREGNVTSSCYDTAGNLVRIVSPSDTISRLYDAAGQLTCVWNSLGAVWYWYNSRGWITTMIEAIDSSYYTSLLGYDADGRQKWVFYPNGVNVSYDYDSYGRLTTVKRQPSTTLLTVTYNKDDTIATETTGDGTKVTTYGYNSRDWPTSIVTKLSGKIKLVLLYSYDDVGNVKQLIVNTTDKAKDAKTENYTYDWLDRLRSASGGNLPSDLTYDHDAVGNAVKFAGKSCTYGSYNKLTSDGTWSYSYDGNGNLAWKTKSNEKWGYEFNSLDQLTKVVKGIKQGQSWTYTTQGEYWYDANGMMAKSVQSGVETHYVYRGHDPLCEKTGSTYTCYVYANGRMVAKLTGTDIYYYIRDALGSTRQVWQGSTQVFSVATYKPFGTPVSASGTEKFEYAGEMIVSVAGSSPGLYYIGARWMNPELGRFISMNPGFAALGDPQTLNRYVLQLKNLVRFGAPTGEKAYSPIGRLWSMHLGTALPGGRRSEMFGSHVHNTLMVASGLRANPQDQAGILCLIRQELPSDPIMPAAVKVRGGYEKAIGVRGPEYKLERTAIILLLRCLELIADETVGMTAEAMVWTIGITKWAIPKYASTYNPVTNVIDIIWAMREIANPSFYGGASSVFQALNAHPDYALPNQAGGYWGSLCGGGVKTVPMYV